MRLQAKPRAASSAAWEVRSWLLRKYYIPKNLCKSFASTLLWNRKEAKSVATLEIQTLLIFCCFSSLFLKSRVSNKLQD